MSATMKETLVQHLLNNPSIDAAELVKYWPVRQLRPNKLVNPKKSELADKVGKFTRGNASSRSDCILNLGGGKKPYDIALGAAALNSALWKWFCFHIFF